MNEISEAELLAQYYAHRDQGAFEELVRRHGPMVMATVRRLLPAEADTEDAFQATFFALAKSHIRRRAAVGAWLHETAMRCAKCIHRQNQEWEFKVKWNTERRKDIASPYEMDETSAILHEELARLPNKYRTAILLCDIEGLTRERASMRLGIPVRTVSDHVQKGRALLSQRLARRGVEVSAIALLAHFAATAAVTADECMSLASHTFRQAMLFATAQSRLAASLKVVRAANEAVKAMSQTRWATYGVTATLAMLLVGSMGYLVGGQLKGTHAIVAFQDGFDGPASVRWLPVSGYDSGTFDTSTGDLVITTYDGAPQVAAALNYTFRDVSIRARVRASHGDMSGTSLLARVSVDYQCAYTAGVSPLTGNAFIQQNLPRPNVLITKATALDPSVEDIWLQFDVVGDQLSLYVWRPGEPKPEKPFISTVDDRFRSGSVGVLVDGPEDGRQRSGLVRSIVVAGESYGAVSGTLASTMQ